MITKETAEQIIKRDTVLRKVENSLAQIHDTKVYLIVEYSDRSEDKYFVSTEYAVGILMSSIRHQERELKKLNDLAIQEAQNG